MTANETEEVPHDHDGPADVARHERGHVETAQNAQGITKADDASGDENGKDRIDRKNAKLHKAQIASPGVPKDTSLEALYYSSGPIPDASMLGEYPPEVQARIIDWHEREIKAIFDDESARQDKLVNAEIRRGYANLATSFIVNAGIVAGTLVAFVVTGDANVFWAYTILGASIVGNVVINIRDKGKDER